MDRGQRSRTYPGKKGRFLPGLKCCLIATFFMLVGVLTPGTLPAQNSEPTKRLFQAVDVNDIGAAKKAIAAGADLTARNATGMTPADLAVDKGHFIIAHYLLSERGTRKTARRNTTPLKALDLTKSAAPSNRKATKAPRQPIRLTAKPANGGARVSLPVAPQKPSATKRQRKVAIKKDRFEYPPRKPQSPITEEVAVAPAPGVEEPDGSEPPENDETESDDTEIPRLVEAPEQAAVAENDVQLAPADQKLGPVGSFFQSLVDLVSPDDPAKPRAERTPAEIAESDSDEADSENEDNPDKHLARELEEESDGPSDLTDLDGLSENVESTDNLADAEPEDQGPEDDTSLLENLEEEGKDGDEPDGPDPEASSAERTFDRIKGLLSDDAPKEDEFGLPIIEDPVAGEPDAVDSVLGQLDDPPGPETGAEREPINAENQGRRKLRVSDALRNRLKRLGDAVSRDVSVDTDAILEAGRNRYAHDVPRGPLEPRRERSDTAAEKIINKRKTLVPRRTPASRFNERLENIQKLERTRENAHGLPRQNRTGTAPMKAAPAVVEQDPSAIDKVVGFFTGKQRKPKLAPKGQLRETAAPNYRKAPDVGEDIVTDPEQSDIANLDAFDQEDETRPVTPPDPAQVRGNIPPQFLNRLSVLFNEEGQAMEQGWKAKPAYGDGAPGVVGEPEKPEESPWTTTSKLNVGEGVPMAVVKIAKTEIPVEEVEIIETPDTTGKRRAMAKAPYSDPLKAPEVKQEARKKAFFSRLTQLFQPKGRDDLPRESLLLEQDEKLSTTHEVLKSEVKVASRTTEGVRTYWPITELTKAEPAAQPERRPNALTRTSLSGVVLTMGESVNLDNVFPPGDEGKDARNQCVKKNRGTTLFCIEPVDWPDDLKPVFQIATILYTGPMAIARFDQGGATRLHSLFDSDNFEKVTAYYQERFGEPTEIWKRSIAPLAKPRMDNPTLSWRDRDPETNAITILEVRKFDDTRGGFPDTRRGAVMLYFINSPPIFPQVSSHELMQLKRVAKATETEAELTPNVDDSPASSEVAPDELFGAPEEPGSTDAETSDPVLDSLIDDTPTPGLDDLLKDSEEPTGDNILDQLTTDDSNDLLNNLPGETPAAN
jgi:hypothetical protein